MDLRRLSATESAVETFVEALFLPYHRELAATVDSWSLAEDVDHVATEVPFLLDAMADDDTRIWVAVDGEDQTDPLAASDLAGFVKTGVDRAPPVFDRPDRLVIGDLYVREPYRGTGLAERLVERAVADADEADCPALALDVDVSNERATAFYERLGFAPIRERRTVPADALR